jgi:hypothetical protein
MPAGANMVFTPSISSMTMFVPSPFLGPGIGLQVPEPPVPVEPPVEEVPAVTVVVPAALFVVPAVLFVAVPAVASSLRPSPPPPPHAPTMEKQRLVAPNSKIEVAFRMCWLMTSRDYQRQRVEKIGSFD